MCSKVYVVGMCLYSGEVWRICVHISTRTILFQSIFRNLFTLISV